METEFFLIDSNSLMTPHLTYYPFDFAKSFWTQMEEQIAQGRIVILDTVKAEILKGNDSLQEWMEHIEIGKLIDHRELSILQKYGEVLQCVQENPVYQAAALAEWARDSVADPWLIATAAVYGYTIVTFETENKGLNSRNPSKNAKIPDVAKKFGVNVKNLYYMMRELNFKL